MIELAVFSDLDGTLLDHETYSYAPAQEALARLRLQGIPLILATSKTAVEVAPLHDELGLGDRVAIVENGAGLYRPGRSMGDTQAYERIRAALDALPAQIRAMFRGFGDLGPDGVADVTGLSPEAARLACQRAHSEPGIWSGDAAQEAAFRDALGARGISAVRGGRFLTLSHGRTKADALREVATELNARITLALGDAPNDIAMLKAATYGIIIRSKHVKMPHLDGEDTGCIRRSSATGPKGWNAEVLAFLDTYAERA